VAVAAVFGFPVRVMPTGILFVALLAVLAPPSAARAFPGAVLAVPGLVLGLLLVLPAGRSLVSATAIGLAREDAVAERMLGKALAADPGSGEARFRLGREFIRQGRLDEASGEFEAALPGFRDPDTWFNLGWIALRQKRYAAAETWFRDGLRRYPRYKARPWADLAAALLGQGKRGEARDAAIRALEIDPAEPAARAMILGKGGTHGR
jgi:tetratricopeptide (TPR) repeat protein